MSKSTLNVKIDKKGINLVWIISHDPALQQRMHSDIHVVHSSCSRDFTGKANPSVVIFDPDGRDVDNCRSELALLREMNSSVPVVVLSEKLDREFVLTLLGVGASGYLLKSSSDARIHEALQEVIDDGKPVSAPVASILIEAFMPSRESPEKFDLKKSEVEYLQLLSEGLTKRDISKRFNRNIHTVDNHVRKIYAKMNVKSVGEAVGLAFRCNVIT